MTHPAIIPEAFFFFFFLSLSEREKKREGRGCEVSALTSGAHLASAAAPPLAILSASVN